MSASTSVAILLLLASSVFDAALSLPQLAFTSSRNVPSHYRKYRRSTTTSFAIPEVASLTAATPMPQFSTIPNTASIFSPQILAATASSTLTYLALIVNFDRPRGHIDIPNPQSKLAIQPSRVPNSGLGLFVTQSLPRGTVLGSYAGVIRPAEQFYTGKCIAYPKAVGYSWRFTDNKFVIDPTDSQGNIQNVCLGGSSEVPFSNLIFATLLRFWSVNTALCRINEPPIGGGGCSVSARQNLETREVVFELIQDVVAGQELYLDYGLDYDRSRYGP